MTKGCPTDGELLARFARKKDAAAFEEIVRRHAPMVRRVCGRILCAAPHDVDDAVQNVFMTLARRASALWTRATVAGWLHRTACHTAMRWRRDAQTRRRHERLAAESRPDPRGGAGLDDPAELLDQVYGALHALPEAYRDALVLHHVEGYTIEEAAALLAAPVGTVAARVSRGRQMIRRRLHDRGVVVAVPVLVAQLGVDAEGESVPAVTPGAAAAPVFAKAASVAQRESCPPIDADEVARAARQSAALWADGARTAAGGSGAGAATYGGSAAVAAPTVMIPLFGQIKLATVILVMAGGIVASAGSVATFQAMAPTGGSRVGDSSARPARTPKWSASSGRSQPTSVPEPSSIGLVAAGATLMLRRRRRTTACDPIHSQPT